MELEAFVFSQLGEVQEVERHAISLTYEILLRARWLLPEAGRDSG